MKIICAFSAIQFSCDHFPGSFASKETCHPIFYLPQKKLLANLGKWASGQLTPIDNYLLYIALLKSTNLVDFRTQCNVSYHTESIIANNMEKLAKIASKISAISSSISCFPRFTITQDTKSLTTTPHWITRWEECYEEYQTGKHKDIDDRGIAEKERALERLIRNPHYPPSTYASKIAEWAAVAGSFPDWNTTSPFSSLPITCSDYWKTLIIKAAHENYLHQVPKIDLQDLLEHCENNIPIGTLFSNTLFKILRNALEKQSNFLGMGDMDVKKTAYTILTSTDSVEDANIRAAIQSAPIKKPVQSEYPTKFAFIKAMLRWETAQKYKLVEDSESEPEPDNSANPPKEDPDLYNPPF